MIINSNTTIEQVLETFPDVHWSIKRMSIVKQMIASGESYRIYTMENIPYAYLTKENEDGRQQIHTEL